MIITRQKTLATIFVVPLLGIRRERLRDERIGFVDGYLRDASKEDVAYEGGVFLLFRPSSKVEFNNFVQEEYARTEILDQYDYADGYVMLVYAIPQALLQEWDLFLSGKFSHFSADLQALYPKVYKIKDPDTGRHRDEMALQWRIFRKANDLRDHWSELLGVHFDEDMEVWSAPNMDHETFSVERFQTPE